MYTFILQEILEILEILDTRCYWNILDVHGIQECSLNMVTPVDHSRIPVFQKFLNLYIDNKTIQTHFNYTPSLHIKHDIVFLMIFLQ